MKLLRAFALVLSLTISTGTSQESTPQPPVKLELKQVKQLTDNLGNIIIQNIMPLAPGELIRIKLLDGTELIGCVGQREEAYKSFIRVQGVVLNLNEECEFGFLALYDGEFRGVVAFKESKKIYTIRYSEIQKAFVFDLQPPKPKERI